MPTLAAQPRDHVRTALPGGLTVRITDYPGNTALDDHRHDHASLILPLAGEFQERVAGHESARRPGALRLIPAGVEHADAYASAGARCLVMEVQGEALASLADCELGGAAIDLGPGSRATDAAACLQHELLRGTRPGVHLWSLALRTLAATIDGVADRSRNAAALADRRQRLDAAARLLRSGDAPITEVACLTGFYDQPHLTRAFRQAFGVTPARYRRLHR